MKDLKLSDITEAIKFSKDYKIVYCVIDGTTEKLEVKTKFKFFQYVTYNNKDYYLK